MTESPKPTPDTLRRARVYWEQSRADLKLSRRRLREGAFLECAYFSLQAATNALSTVCRLHGHVQLPQHSLGRLAELCAEADGRFRGPAPSLAALEAVMARSPFEPPQPDAEAQSRACLDHAETILDTVRGYLREHRRRYFAP
ncbi:MAG: HEPN domain-containing protein [Candidatus Lambdaproteobacteria bacterium]|nr:HEPN domain-containing protein [Candidatus Lambdaproteobacteria bacterium]